MVITTELDLRKFLSSKDIPCHEVEVLSGGFANFCWRIKTLLGRRSIIKHAEPFLRSLPDVQIPTARMDYEYLALSSVPNMIPGDEHVQLPQVYHYFQAEHVIDMFDGGMKTLKESYIEDATLDIPTLATRVGTWLARLHNATSTAENLALVKEKFDNKIAKMLFRFSYQNVGIVLEKFGFDRGLGDRINDKFGSKLDTDQKCLTHGDFWAGNLLVEDHTSLTKIEEVDDGQTAPALTVTDWEMVRIGNGATDVGQFAAEAWLLDRFHGKKGFMDAFLKAYLKERPLSEEDKLRVAVHFGVHITFQTPAAEWANEEETKLVVQIGQNLLEAIDEGHLSGLKTGALKTLFET